MKAGGKSRAQNNAILFGSPADLVEQFDRFGHAAIQVFAIESVTHGDNKLQMADAGGDGPFIAFQVWDQSGKLDSRESVELRGYGFRICQLRHPFRMNKTGGLNVLDTSGNELLDQS